MCYFSFIFGARKNRFLSESETIFSHILFFFDFWELFSVPAVKFFSIILVLKLPGIEGIQKVGYFLDLSCDKLDILPIGPIVLYILLDFSKRSWRRAPRHL